MLGDAVRRNRMDQGLSQEDLAKRAHVSRKHISSLERGANVTIDVVQKVAQALELSEIRIGGLLISPTMDQDAVFKILAALEVAATGIEDARKLLSPMRRPARPHGDESPAVSSDIFSVHPPADSPVELFDDDDDEEFVTVPVRGYAAAGTGIEMMDWEETATIPRDMAPVKPNEFILRARGDSMIDFDIHDGDLLLVERRDGPGKVAANGEVVIGWLSTSTHEGVVVKRWLRKRGRIALISGNESHPPILLDPTRGDRFELQAIVRKSLRRVKPRIIEHEKISG